MNILFDYCPTKADFPLNMNKTFLPLKTFRCDCLYETHLLQVQERDKAYTHQSLFFLKHVSKVITRERNLPTGTENKLGECELVVCWIF